LLFSVIGVGISDSQKEYVTNLLENRTAVEAAQDSDVIAGDADIESVATSAQSKIPTLLQYNAGNTGFLIPLPVRAVFSSLYIVEGLARSVGVIFTKFNRAMVPMRCTVDLQMEAKYIGFAKKKTFFTNALEEAKDAARELWVLNQEKKEAVHLAASRVLTDINIKTAKGNEAYAREEYDDDTYSIFSLINQGNTDSQYATTMAQFPEAIQWRNNNSGQDPIVEFFDQGYQVSVNASVFQTIYRYSPDLVALEGTEVVGNIELTGLNGANANERVAAFNIPNTPKTAIRRGIDEYVTPIYHAKTGTTPQFGNYDLDDSLNISATTKEEWIAMSQFLCAAPNRPWNVNGSATSYLDDDSSFYEYDHEDYYFAVKYGGSITLTVDGYSVTGTIGSPSVPDLGFVFGHLDRSNRDADVGADIVTGLKLPIYWPAFVMDDVPPQWADDPNDNSGPSDPPLSIEDIILVDPGLI
jgi:hypothetical protein